MESAKKDEFSATPEARAVFDLMSAKEFLILATLFILACDTFDVYTQIIRVTGWDWMPLFGANQTLMHYTDIPELSWYDLVISSVDWWCVLLLSLAVCANSIDGIICSLCGFTSCLVLEFIYVVWLCVAVAVDSIETVSRASAALFFLCLRTRPRGTSLRRRLSRLRRAAPALRCDHSAPAPCQLLPSSHYLPSSLPALSLPCHRSTHPHTRCGG